MQPHSFESFIIQTCRAREWDLRKFLKKKLISAGFVITEDNYQSDRVGGYGSYKGNPNYAKVRNMLAVRGKPRVCLVAHTDICRDHHRNISNPPNVFPVIKDREGRKIIQDKDKNYQTGGDDRLGVAINTWIALNTGYDVALLFTTDEEIGLVSACRVRFEELEEYDLLVQVDRGNHSQQLVTEISGPLCSRRTAKRLLSIASDMGIPRVEVHGLATDVDAIVRNRVAREAVNMTCGYHMSHGDGREEYIDIEESRDTMHYVSKIIQYYDLEMDHDESQEPSGSDRSGRKPIIISSESEEEVLAERQLRLAKWLSDFTETEEEIEIEEGMTIEEYAVACAQIEAIKQEGAKKRRERRLSKKEKRKYAELFDEVDRRTANRVLGLADRGFEE